MPNRTYELPETYNEVRNRTHTRRNNQSNGRTTFTFKCPICGYSFRLRKERTIDILAIEGEIYDLNVSVDVRCPNCYCGFYFDCYYNGKRKERTDYWTYCDNDDPNVIDNYSEGFKFKVKCNHCNHEFRFTPNRNSVLVNFREGKITFKIICPNCNRVQRVVFNDCID